MSGELNEPDEKNKICENCGAVYNPEIADKCPVCRLEERIREKYMRK